MDISYKSLEEIENMAINLGIKISEVTLMDQASSLECTKTEVIERMQYQYEVMKSSVQKGIDKDIRSTSGLTGGDAYRMSQARKENKTLCGSFFSGALMRAISVGEVNASMGRIVASPTAGSSGIVPAAIITMQEEKNLSDEDCIMALLTASAIGMVISNNASLSGAEGGCQAECGSAAGMAAGALVELAGGNPHQVVHAVAIAMKNILGLVCDPVAGLVEVPCIKRNASGVANAIVAAEMALADIKSVIPADEVIIAMKKVGDGMPRSLKETAEGGLAKTPTAERLAQQIFGSNPN